MIKMPAIVAAAFLLLGLALVHPECTEEMEEKGLRKLIPSAKEKEDGRNTGQGFEVHSFMSACGGDAKLANEFS